LALDVVFIGEAEAAVGLQAGVGRFPGSLGGQVLGHVGRSTGIAAGVVLFTGAPAHQVGRFQLDVRFGDWELHALVLADRATKHHAVTGVLGRFFGEPAAITYALGGDQGALGVQAVEDVAEALALFADQAAGGDFQVVEEQLVGLVVDHVG